MSLGDGFMYFGANGVYSVNAQNAAASQNTSAQYQLGNIYGGTTTATSTINALGGILGGAAIQYYPAPQALVNAEEKVVKAVKRAAKGILSKLRYEIDDWHGDVLERCPA